MDSETEYTFEDYMNCTLFDVHRWSEYPEVLAVRNEMFEILGYKGDKKQINHVTVLLLNLYHTYCIDPDMWILYSRNRNDYNYGKRYNQLFIKYDILIDAVDKLFELKYIDHVKGFNDRRPGGQEYGPRMKAKQKLIDLIENKHAVTFRMIGDYAPDELIELRNADGDPVDYADDNKSVKEMLPGLVAYNDLLNNTYIDIHFDVPDIEEKIKAKRKKKHKKTGLPKEYRLTINLSNKRVKRIFNNSTFNQGGRFYGGWWQNIPRELRPKIIINRDYTIETDFSGLHIYLLYALKGINFTDLHKEPYIYPKDSDPLEIRPIFKKILLAAINSKDEATCIKAVQSEINMNRSSFPDEYPNLKDAYHMFKEYHSDIADMFCSKAGLKLQRWDSAIAQEVVDTLTKEGIPVLVMHDSFICSKKEESYLHDIMVRAYHRLASRLNVKDELNQTFSTSSIGSETKDITLKIPETLREDDITIDYLSWLDKPQARRFTNFLLTENPDTNVAIKVRNESITEIGLDLEEPVFDKDEFDTETVIAII